jgi:uncharacterized protein YbjQ (UPF0145 family)
MGQQSGVDNTDSEAKKIEIILLYTKALKKLSDKEIGSLMEQLKEQLKQKIGKNRYQQYDEMVAAARKSCANAVIEFFKKSPSLTEGQVIAFEEELNISVVSGVENLSDFKLEATSESEDKFAKVIDIIKMDPGHIEEFIKQNPLMGELLGIQEKASRTMREDVRRGLRMMMLAAVFLVGILIMSDPIVLVPAGMASFGLSVPAGINMAATAASATHSGLPLTAAVLGISEVATAAMRALQTITPLVGFGLSYGTMVLGFSESITSKILGEMNREMNEEEKKEFKTGISSRISKMK